MAVQSDCSVSSTVKHRREPYTAIWPRTATKAFEGALKIELETTQTLDGLLHQVLNTALVIIGAEGGSLMLVDDTREIMQIKARLGPPRLGRKTEVVYKTSEKSVAAHVVRTKRAYLCPDVGKDPHFVPSRSGKNFSSLLSMPIINKGRVMAVINADSSQRRYFTKTHEKQLKLFATQVAKPIASRVGILDALAQIGTELTRSPHEGGISQVLQTITSLAVRSLGADVVTLYEYIQESDRFPVEGTGPTIAGKIKDPRPMRRKVFQGDVPWTIVKQRNSDFYSEVRQHKFLKGQVHRPGDKPRPRFIEREGIKSMAALLLPFRAGKDKTEEVVGVMFANYRTRHDFNSDERSALATFADYAATAILNARNEERRRSEQMTMAEAISGGFGHRMSHLVGASRASSQIIRERNPDIDQISKKALNRIEREADLLLRLSEKWAGWLKKEPSARLELVDVAVILRDVLQRATQDAPRILIKQEIARNMPAAKSVEFQLRQTVQDVIENAIEAMGQQGTLTVRTRINAKSSRVEVEIQDSGIGISKEIFERLFSPATTTKKDRLGVGLWLGRTFMRATGGDLSLLNTGANTGSTFLIEIPRAFIRAGAERQAPRPDKIGDILIVDDDPEWLDTLRDGIADFGYSVDVANNFEAAKTAFAERRFRLAVIDIRLVDAEQRNSDGLRLAKEMQAAKLNTKIILVSGWDWPMQAAKDAAAENPLIVGFFNKKRINIAKYQELVRTALNTEPS
jgi:signal transduction histidine kinase